MSGVNRVMDSGAQGNKGFCIQMILFCCFCILFINQYIIFLLYNTHVCLHSMIDAVRVSGQSGR